MDESLSGDATTTSLSPACEPSQLQNYFDKLLHLVLEAEISDLKNSLCSNDTTEKLNRFINDPQVNVIFFTKKRVNKDEQSYSYTCTQEITYNSNNVAFVAFTKHVPTLDCSRTIQSQIQLINLSGPASSESGSAGVSPYEALHSYVHHVVAPYFDAYVREKEVNKVSNSDKKPKIGIPMAKMQITDLELSLLHLQQNVEIPDISIINSHNCVNGIDQGIIINIHPIVQETVKKCKQERKRVSVDMIDSALLSDSMFLNKLQGDVNGWIKEIIKVTQLSRDPASGTAIQEIDFWLSMEKALEGIDEQLKDDHIELTLSILRHAKHSHTMASFLHDTGLKESMNKGISIYSVICYICNVMLTNHTSSIMLVHNYNKLMKDFPINELLFASDLNKVKESLIIIFGHLRKLRLSSYPINKALALIEVISRDLNDQLIKVLGSRRLMYMDYEEFEKVMASAEDVFRTWDEMTKESTNIVHDITPDKFTPIKISHAHNNLQERVTFVRNFRKQHEQLHKTIIKVMSQPKSTTRIVNTNDVNSMEEVKLAYDRVKDIDVLDISPEGTEIWMQAENSYNERVSCVDNQIIANIHDRLAICKNSNDMFRVFSKFNALFVRPKIHEIIEEYRTQLIDSVNKDIKKLQDKFTQQYSNSEVYHMAQLHDFPVVSGFMIWVQQIERQLQTYVKRLEDVLGKGWEMCAEGQKLQTDNDNFKKQLDTRPIFEAWQKNMRHELNISGCLLKITKNSAQGNILQLGVNLDPQIITLFKEVRNFLWLNHQVPHTISSFAKVSKHIYPFAVSLIETVRSYTQTVHKVQKHPEIIMLVASYQREVQVMITKGLNCEWRYFVETYDRDGALDSFENQHVSFVREFANQVSIFQEKVDFLIDSYDDISRHIDDLKTCAYEDRKFQGNLDKIQILIDRLNLESYSNLNMWVAQLDKRIETILVNRLQQAIERTVEFMISGDEITNSTEPMFRESVSISGKVVKMNKRRTTRNDSIDGERSVILRAEKPTLVVSTYEVCIRNQVIYLDPPIEDARANWYNQLHGWLAIACGLPRLQSSREISTRETYSNLLIQIPGTLLEKAYDVIETKLKEVSEYVNVWLQFQSLWDLEATNVYAHLGDDFLKWQRILTEIKKLRNTFDNSNTSRSFGLIEIDYQQAQSKVNTKYDSWQQEILNKFGTKIAGSMCEFNKSVSHARNDLENKSMKYNNSSEAIDVVTFVQDLKRKVSKWDQDVEIFRNGQKILERQRYQFPNDWIYIDHIENEWSAFNQIFKRKDNVFKEQVDSLKTKFVTENKIAEGKIKEIAAEWAEAKPIQGDIKPDIATNTLNIFENRVTRLKEKYDFVFRAKEALNMESASKDHLGPVVKELGDLKSVWSFLSKVWQSIDDLKDQSWSSVVPDKIKQQLDSLLDTTKEMPSHMCTHAAFEYVQDTIKQYVEVNPILSELKSETLKERHWKQIFKVLRIESHVLLTEMTLGMIWDMNLKKNELVIKEIVTQASSEELLDLLNAQEEDKYLKKEKEDIKELLADLAKNMVAEILNEVTELYKAAQYNKNITKILVERIDTANSALREDDLSSKDYISLQGLVHVLQKMKKYIEEITQYNTTQEFLETEFKDLCKKYDASIKLLNFVDTRKFNFNAQKEDKALKNDVEKLLKFQAALVESMTNTNMDPIYFELFVPLIKGVAEILSKVTDLYCTAEHNKQITKILIECIAAANSAVSVYILRDYSFTLKDYSSLQGLVKVLQDMKKFIEKITQCTVQEFLEVEFRDLCEKYDTSINLLKFVDFKKFNAQEDVGKLLKFQAKNMNDMKQKVTSTNDKMNLVVKQVRSLIDNKKGTNQNKIEESPLPFKDYKETEISRSNKFRKYVHIKSQNDCAFKFVEKKHIDQIKNQVAILKNLKYCQNIIHFYGFTFDGNRYYLVTEWAQNGNLREYISEHKNIEIKFRLRFAYDIAKGLNFLNAVKVVHRDIRPENIIITDRDVAKITNFSVSTGSLVNKECVLYIAPEILNTGDKTKYNTKCEVYSFGILLWEIAEWIPYEEVKEITKEALISEMFTAGTAIPEKYKILVKKSVDKNPDVRPTFAEMLIDLKDIFISVRDLWIKNSIKEKSIKYLEWNELIDKSKIGSGHFGYVFKAYWSKTNNYVVCKKLINLNDIIQNQIYVALQHEIQIHIRAHACENIIRFLGITQDSQDDNYCMVMEYADDGDLRIYLEKNFPSLDWNKKYQLAIDITNGIHYLHKENILHRDLHAKNIVIQKGRAKITDFGYAKDVETQTKLHQGVFGMTPYMAPELLKPQPSPFSKKTDIYSLGVLLWELSSGYPPFKNINNEVINIINGMREQKIQNTPSDYYNLYTACWNDNPEKRPDIKNVYDQLKAMLPKNDEIIIIKDKKVDIKDTENSSSVTLAENSQTSTIQKNYEVSESNLIDFMNNK